MKSFFVLCLAAVAVQAAIIRVPSEQPTIQAGLYAALSGDTVFVAPGTYYERIVWPAVDGISLASEGGAETTVVSGADSGRVVTMNAMDYTGATKLCGFTLPLGLAAGLLYLVALYFAKILAGMFVGRWLFRVFGGHSASLWLTTPVGIILVYALCAIPVVGWLVWLFAAVLGFGVIVELLGLSRRAADGIRL